MPANRAASITRVEPHYLELVDYITSTPDAVISPATYLDWPRRDTGIDWIDGDATTPERAIGMRLSTLSVAATLPVRPHIPSPYRRTVWLATLLDAGGAFYRTGHGKSASYVLDTSAQWRRTGGHDRIHLVGHRWAHNPISPVRKLMPAPVYEPDAPADPTPLRLVDDPAPVAAPVPVDPTPDDLMAAAEAAATPETPADPGPRYSVVAADPRPDGEVVVSCTATDDRGRERSFMVLATVKAVVPVVGS